MGMFGWNIIFALLVIFPMWRAPCPGRPDTSGIFSTASRTAG